VQVSFIIPLFNCLPLTQAMLASLRATLPPALDHEIILVDDGSTDGTRDWLATLAIRGFASCSTSATSATPPPTTAPPPWPPASFSSCSTTTSSCCPHWLEPMLGRAHRRLPHAPGLIGNVQRDFKTGAVDHAGIVFNLTANLSMTARFPLPLSRSFAAGPARTRPHRCLPARRAVLVANSWAASTRVT
jgi:hypothetical protein